MGGDWGQEEQVVTQQYNNTAWLRIIIGFTTWRLPRISSTDNEPATKFRPEVFTTDF